MKQSFKIGDRVVYEGQSCEIIGFNQEKTVATVQFYPHSRFAGHSGDGRDYWYDDNGLPLPYVKGDRRYYVSLVNLKKDTYEPIFKFLL